MHRFNPAARRLLTVTVLLSALALTACAAPQQVILQSSAPMRIQHGDLPRSPEAKGWLLSDEATAKLLEAAEACQQQPAK